MIDVTLNPVTTYLPPHPPLHPDLWPQVVSDSCVVGRELLKSIVLKIWLVKGFRNGFKIIISAVEKNKDHNHCTDSCISRLLMFPSIYWLHAVTGCFSTLMGVLWHADRGPRKAKWAEIWVPNVAWHGLQMLMAFHINYQNTLVAFQIELLKTLIAFQIPLL